MRTKTPPLRLSGFQSFIFSLLFILLGLLLPTLSDNFKMEPVLLTMNIPVLLAGFLLPLPYSLLSAVFTPLLGFFVIGVPNSQMYLPVVIIQYMVFVAESNLLYRLSRLNIFLTLIITMVSGYAAAGVAISIFTGIFAIDLIQPVAYLSYTIETGFIGLLIQTAAIPPLVSAIGKTFARRLRRSQLPEKG